MFNEHWNILIVDDEPDVLQVTKLAMQDITVYGLPVNILTATSKADAIELMQQLPAPAIPIMSPPLVSVAIIDVVMENNQAGLELCEYIRRDLGNHELPLYIRTGQPGTAPERSVIDNYEINGYFSKAEATEDKLYTIIKTGVRQRLNATTAYAACMASLQLMSAKPNRAILRQFIAGMLQGGRPGHFTLIDGEHVSGTADADKARALIAELEQQAGVPLGDDTYLILESPTAYHRYIPAGKNQGQTLPTARSRSGLTCIDPGIVLLGV
ncbi:MAG: response regulator [Chloroflexota bacterium]